MSIPDCKISPTWGRVLSPLFFLLYLYLLYLLHQGLQSSLPYVIYGTWRSYILMALLYSLLEAALYLPCAAIMSLVRYIYRPRWFRIVGAVATLGFAIHSIAQIFHFVGALYYAGFWEYFWAAYLSLLTAVAYFILCLCIVIAPHHPKLLTS